MRSLSLLLFLTITFSQTINYLSFSNGIDQGNCTIQNPCKTFDYILQNVENSTTIKILGGNVLWNCEDPVTISSRFINIQANDDLFTFINNPNCPISPYGLFYLDDGKISLKNLSFLGFSNNFIVSESSGFEMNFVTLKNYLATPFKGSFDYFKIENSFIEGNNIKSNILLEKESKVSISNLTSFGSSYLFEGGKSNSISITKSKFDGTKTKGLLEISAFDKVDIINSVFSSVEDGRYGSGISLKNVKGANIIDNEFIELNSVRGGAVYINSCEYVHFLRNYFSNNYAMYGGAIYIDGKYVSSINNTFIRNKSLFGGAIYIYSIVNFGLYIEQSNFIQNLAETGGAITAINSFLLNIKNSSFLNNTAESGGALHLTGSSFDLDDNGKLLPGIVFSNVLFSNNKAQKNGGAIYIAGNIILESINLLFNNNNAFYGGSIYSIITTQLEISHSLFENCVSLSGGGAIDVYGGKTFIKNTIFNRNKSDKQGGAIRIQLEAKISFQECLFEFNSADIGGAIFNSLSTSCDLLKCFFKDNTAQNGGAVFFDRLFRGSMIEDSQFIKNHGMISGGALSITSGLKVIMVIYLNNNTFIENFGRNGGAIYFSSETRSKKILSFGKFKNYFIKNKAYAGGFLYVKNSNYIPISILEEINESESESIAYGPKLASSPTNIILNEKEISVFPSQFFNITFQVSDYYNQLIPQESILFSLISNPKFKVLGTNEQTLYNGAVDFSYLQIFSNETFIILNIKSEYITTFIRINITSCPPGYQRIKIGDIYTCQSCPEGTFSLDEDSETCDLCPDNARCIGNKIIAETGYWTFINQNEVSIHYCSNYKCKGGNKCSDHRDPEAPVCGACLQGYSEWGGICKKCEKVSAFWFVLFLGYFFIIFAFYHILSQTKHGGAFIILFFFTQSMLLLIGSTHTYFSWLEPIFDMDLEKFEAIFIILGCPFERSSMGRIITNIAKPILFFILLAIIFPFSFLIHCLCQRRKKSEEVTPLLSQETPNENLNLNQDIQENNQVTEEINDQKSENLEKSISLNENNRIQNYWNYFKDLLYKSFIDPSAYAKTFTHLLIISYFIFTKVGFSYLICLKFGDSRYLSASTDIKCFSPEYNAWLPLFIILILYSILFPIFLAIFLFTLKRKNLLEKYENYFGGLYEHYKHEYFWYEFLSIFRRTIIISTDVFCKVFLQELPGVKYIIMQIIFFILLLIHIKIEPYQTRSENFAERISLIVMIILLILRGSASFEYSQDWIKITIILIATFTVIGLFLHAVILNMKSLIKMFKKKE